MKGLVWLILSALAVAQQIADPDFKPQIDKPAFTKKRPRVAIDQAHENFHTVEGRYKPFAELLRADGFEVGAGTTTFEQHPDADILVIANAEGKVDGQIVGRPSAQSGSSDSSSAFTPAEIDALYQWVEKGGSLLLIADHKPFGAAAALLGRRFGVTMGDGYVFDVHSENIVVRTPARRGSLTFMVYSDANKLLGNHPIIRGRNEIERVHRVVTFTGQSLTVPPKATALLRLGPDAMELQSDASFPEFKEKIGLEFGQEAILPPKIDPAKLAELKAKYGVAGRAQGLAMKVGKGRVVIMGEAAMFSAQIFKGQKELDGSQAGMGMNVKGTDDRQFALNVMHWLARILN